LNVNSALTPLLISMGDLSITASQVFPSPGASSIKGISGGVISVADVVALNSAGKLVQADANGTPPTDTPIGIAVAAAAGVGQFVNYVSGDKDLTLGSAANPAPGIPYFLSANPGKMCTASDLVTGMKSSLIGFGKSGGKLAVSIVASGQTI
jgi:hypothetical protein